MGLREIMRIRSLGTGDLKLHPPPAFYFGDIIPPRKETWGGGEKEVNSCSHLLS